MDILIAGAVVLALDQSTKRIVRTRGRGTVSLASIVTVRHVTLVRSSFEQPSGRVVLLLTWTLAVVSAVVLWRAGVMFQTDLARAGIGAALGGAAGNLIDILRRRCVTDFVDLGWWPVFNLADVGIVAGLILAFAPLP